ncbi:Phosphoribulokinase [Nymphaea thermarum]|nr:Phosphoribulokinase [Nymphaea thermarum]
MWLRKFNMAIGNIKHYEQVKKLKEGITVEKPINNHVTGLLDPPEVQIREKSLNTQRINQCMMILEQNDGTTDHGGVHCLHYTEAKIATKGI